METIYEPNMKSRELGATYQNSYYGKAKEIEYDGYKFLKSYKTIVCAIKPNGEFVRFWNDYSVTTMNHINDFRNKNGLSKLSKKEWKELKVNETMVIPNEVQKVEMKYTTTYFS